MSDNDTTAKGSNQPTALEPHPLRLMVVSAIQCFAVLIGFFIAVYVAYVFTSFRASPWMEFAALFAAIHFAAWRYGRRIANLLDDDNLLRLTIGCSVAFGLFDVGLTRAPEWAGLPAKHPEDGIAVVVVQFAICALEVAAMVFVTVPLGQKIYGRSRVA